MDLLMDIDGVNENACWTLPENFDVPLVTFIDEAQEEHIFGHEDLYLRSIQLHSNTLIQLERWFTSSGQTRVTVVGPLRAKRWLMDMIRSVGSQQAYHQARGEKMLHHVQNQTLSTADLDDSFSMPAYIFVGAMDLLMDIDGVNENACWTLPENFDVPLVTFIDEARKSTYLLCLPQPDF
ncbi:putative KHDC1-like protein [Peromyscus leucopus]|uniref:putative KHDC1-like protein n=1 Tax=Peromyscus leucopus TaxID=10041 RepID=UPI0018858FE4|nr:putative KHDC1-like protein [Peromyscus leucopus]